MKLYTDILLEEERIKILEAVKQNVKDFGPKFPGLQTPSFFHQHKTMQVLLKKIKPYYKNYDIIKCWANFSLGNIISWHNHHGSDKTMIYFLENKCNMGPMLKKEGCEIEITRCPENSLLIFNSNIAHSAPCHLPEERYSIAFEMIKK
jgi:hypothetical protein